MIYLINKIKYSIWFVLIETPKTCLTLQFRKVLKLFIYDFYVCVTECMNSSSYIAFWHITLERDILLFFFYFVFFFWKASVPSISNRSHSIVGKIIGNVGRYRDVKKSCIFLYVWEWIENAWIVKTLVWWQFTILRVQWLQLLTVAHSICSYISPCEFQFWQWRRILCL